jgi:hypothetical protein
MVHAFKRLVREAGWAPLAVCLLALAVCDPRSGTQYWSIHFLGGAAVAFFFFHAARVAHAAHGEPAPPDWRRFAFFAACASAAAWEIGEFLIDHAMGSWLQKGLQDTAGDLAFAMLGAAMLLMMARPRLSSPVSSSARKEWMNDQPAARHRRTHPYRS